MRVKPSFRNRGIRPSKPYDRPANSSSSANSPTTSGTHGSSHTTTWNLLSGSFALLESNNDNAMGSASSAMSWEEEVADFLGSTACSSGSASPCSSPNVSADYSPPSVDELDSRLQSLSVQSQVGPSPAPPTSSFFTSHSISVDLPPCFVPASAATIQPTRQSAFLPYTSKPHPSSPVSGHTATSSDALMPPTLTSDSELSPSPTTLENIQKMPYIDRTDSDVTLVDGSSERGDPLKVAAASKIVDALVSLKEQQLAEHYEVKDGSEVQAQATQSAISVTLAGTLAM
ncbi:hypothetical protein HDZ31DRAFT_66011 [Schizophyllum fasciatum]